MIKDAAEKTEKPELTENMDKDINGARVDLDIDLQYDLNMSINGDEINAPVQGKIEEELNVNNDLNIH